MVQEPHDSKTNNANQQVKCIVECLFGFILHTHTPFLRSEPTACPWTHEQWNEVYAYYVARDKKSAPQLYFDVASYLGSLYLASYSSRKKSDRPLKD